MQYRVLRLLIAASMLILIGCAENGAITTPGQTDTPAAQTPETENTGSG